MSDLDKGKEFAEEIHNADMQEILEKEVDGEDALMDLVEKDTLSSRTINTMKGTYRMLRAFGNELPGNVLQSVLQLIGKSATPEDNKNVDKSDAEETPMPDKKPALTEDELQKKAESDEEEKVKATKAAKPPFPPKDEDKDKDDDDMKKKKKVAKADDTSEEVETISKADYEDLKATAEAIRKEQAETKKELEDERNARSTEKAIAKAAVDYDHIPVDSKELGPIVKAVTDNLTKEQAETFERILKAAEEAMVTSKAFKDAAENTNILADSGSAVSRLNEIAKSYIEKSDKPLTQNSAFAKAVEANPRLYDEYVAETRGQK